MRIIAGRFRRRQLRAPRGGATRPSTDRTRESLFNMLEARISFEGVSVLDLFAGSGALGLEALSRGALEATFVESDARAVVCVRENASALGVIESCHFVRSDAVRFIERHRGKTFDLILADPPYELAQLPELPAKALPHLPEDGLFVLEHDVRHRFDDHPQLLTSRAYGRTLISIFAPAPREE